jgi:NAD(P)-dependent dehydrogenase (short-subunit alcohol dehydrogenase family)
MQLNPGMVAVVTGAASGIGLGLAAEFGRRGLHVVMADLDADEVGAQALALASETTRVLAVPTDVRDPAALDALAATVEHDFGRVDVFVSNAGVVPPRRVLWETEARDVDWVLDVNVKGLINGARSFVPLFARQGHGHIVHTASTTGLSPLPFYPLYTAAKHAIVGLSWCLRAELAYACPGVGFTLLAPGGVHSRLKETARFRPALAVGARELAPATEIPDQPEPLRITPEEVARQVTVAIERDQPLVVTDAGAVGRIREWLESVAAELDKCPPADPAPGPIVLK